MTTKPTNTFLGIETTIWENVGTGTTTYANNKANLSVTSGQYVIRRGKHICHYYSGKSQLIEATFDNFQVEANTTKQVGYYTSSAVSPYNTAYDGFFLYNDGTTIRLQAYRFGTLTADIPWTSWNNYAAISSYDWSKFTVAVFDFLWLGGTELRLFLKINGGFILAHTFIWASTQTDTFIGSPNQSVRYELRSTTGSGSFRSICSQVATEGDIGSSGKNLGLYNASAITANTVGTIYALKSFKKVAAFRDLSVVVSSIGVVNTGTADQGIVLLIVNPTLSSAITYATKSKITEGTPTNQTITANTGRVIYCQPAGSTSSASGLADNFLSYWGMSIADVSDEIVLAYMPVTANQSVYGMLTVKEL